MSSAKPKPVPAADLRRARCRIGHGVVFLLLLAAMALPSPVGSVESAQALPAAQSGKEAVIVELSRGGTAQAVARALGVVPTHVYSTVFNGFSAELPAGAVRAAERQPGVAGIWPDLPVEAFEQKLPTGVDRVDADLNPWADFAGGGVVDADVAVLDTGIAPHPDLNIADGKDCSEKDTNNWIDGDGHGTHVAGTIAAINNDSGVVGVAPGANLWAIKVLDNTGSGSWSDVMCGLDWVAENAAAQGIKVINMSLGGGATKADKKSCDGNTSPLHEAICHVVNDAGVSVVVAAGNEGTNAGRSVPARYPEVITVSAFKDLNGEPGGGGKSRECGKRNDDTFAKFSNHGSAVDIAAPGVCILSTWPGGKYQIISGTSMATPHVTGAIALYIAQGSGPDTPEAVRNWLMTEASQPQNSEFGFKKDPDTYREPVLYLGPG